MWVEWPQPGEHKSSIAEGSSVEWEKRSEEEMRELAGVGVAAI